MSDPEAVMVQPIKPYDDAVEGWKDPKSPAYLVSRTRASELKANGLVKEADDTASAAKASTPPNNKMATAPANKAAEVPAVRK